jgi:death-on-curing protein
MIRFLTLEDVYRLQQRALMDSGGMPGVRDADAVESSVAQPQMTFSGEDLYPALSEKAASLGFSLIKNHAFNDANKRVGHAAMETFLVINGYEFAAIVDEQERVILAVAASKMGREEFTEWVCHHVVAFRKLSP